MTTYRPSYVSLVAALRAEFDSRELAAISAEMTRAGSGIEASHRLPLPGAWDTLNSAIRDASDSAYDPGENAHPGVREHFSRTGGGL